MQRIICGYQRYKSKTGVLLVFEPDSEILYNAHDVYMSVFEDCMKEGIIDDKDVLAWLYERNYWSELQEHQMTKGLPDLIEDTKIELYNRSYDEFAVIQLRTTLNNLKLELLELYQQKHKYDYTTSNGIANFMKNYYIVEQCVKRQNKEPYDWSETGVIPILSYKDGNSITDETIRSIAKYSDWKGIWYSSKHSHNLFNRLAVDLTADQKRLIFWSSFYDNLSEHPECPPERIVEDDDMIDGWVAIQRRKREKEKVAEDTQNKITNSKIKNSDEIFIVARDAKHAEDIESLNSPQAAAIKQARLNQINRNGTMKDLDFKDVQAKLLMEGVRKGHEKLKGR